MRAPSVSETASIKGFQFTPTGIAGILKAHRLRVPPYQREYAWSQDEVTTLYSDYSLAKSENTDYFLGTIVTIKAGRSEPLEIVDGQQRLTTTALLITAIRDHLGVLGMDLNVLESVNSDYLSTFDRKQNGRIPRLTLNIDDHAFFEALIGGGSPPTARESHERLVAALKTAREHVKSIVRPLAVKDQPAILNDWLEFLEHSATVILVETQNGAQAFKMFETLNDRGLKTSQADLVKSYLFGQSGTRIQEAQSKWSSMKDNLEEIDDDDRAINFLRHSIIATRRFIRAEAVYDFAQSVRGESNSVAFLAELERLSRVYVATFRSTSSHWSGYPVQAQRALSVFNTFDIKPMRPLVLSLAMSFAPADFAEAMVLLVSVAVRLVIAASTRSGTVETTFSSAAISVYTRTITNTPALKEAIKSMIVSNQDFSDSFATLRVSRAELARYYLHTLEAAVANESEPWFVANDDPAVMTLEHVMPSNACEPAWVGVDDETRRKCVKRLGNLCILNKRANNEFRDGPFIGKRAILAEAPYKLTSEIGAEASWDFEAIEKRQRKMAEVAQRAWLI